MEKAGETNPGGYSVAFFCRTLGISRSAYHAHVAARPARRRRGLAEESLVREIRALHAGSRGAYGAPPIHAALVRAGRVVNIKRVERLMRVNGVVGITRRQRRGLTRQAKRAVFAADLIGRDFTAPRPGMRLVGDMTELVTLEGKMYLATCIDMATREVIGWAMADRHRAELPMAALRMEAGRGRLEAGRGRLEAGRGRLEAGCGRLEAGCIMHTDRGSEYTSTEFRYEIRELGIGQSMGRVGSCYDNAAAESWFALFKAEIGTSAWANRPEARADVFFYRSRVQPHQAPQASRTRVRHPARNQGQTAARLHPCSIETRCPRSGENFNRNAVAFTSGGVMQVRFP